jgi:hypothetical protein
MSNIRNLKVSQNRRNLVHEDGSPFFWLGDTAWELFHKLGREEADQYLQNRADNMFNVIQAVALSGFEGLSDANTYGRLPLRMNDSGSFDPTLPDTSGDYSYWDHIDYIIDKAAEYGLYIALLPTWGDKFNKTWGGGPVIFNKQNAYTYGSWIGKRYRDKGNIIWVMGGDRPLETRMHFDVVNEMARGIKENSGGKHLMTFHPNGYKSSSFHLHEEEWLDFNMIQTSHGALNVDSYNLVKADYDRFPVKPTLDSEPRYEDHPINFSTQNGYFDDYDVRQGAYWAVFAGAFGHTYGHHCIWSMRTEITDYYIMQWKTAIHRPGSLQMKYLRELMESRPFLDRVPDQEQLAENYPGANHQQATRGLDYAFFYSPCGLKIKVNMGRISCEKVRAAWFDPRTGESTGIGEFDNTGIVDFMPPSSGRNNDWVLILDDASNNYSL